MTRATATCTAFDGNAALRVEPAGSLVLLEGGLGARRREGRRRERAARLTARQVTTFVLAALAVTVALVAACLVAEGRAAAQRAGALEGVGERVVVVQPGDSLWSIAEGSDVAGASTSDVVSWMMERNALRGAELSVGQRLVAPAPALG
ncbi:LysM peptidoglycan-binding domain-containing protein [Thermophilibacter sp.]